MLAVIIIALLFFAAGCGFFLVLQEDNGYVLFSYGGLILETSLIGFVLAALLFLIAAILLWKLLKSGVLFPKHVRDAWRARRARRSQEALNEGLMLYSSGQLTEAEATMVRYPGKDQAALLNLLFAARIAQQLKAYDRRDRYLQRAGLMSEHELPVLLTQAELQVDQGQNTQALASLTRLMELESDHPQVLAQLMRVHRALRDWTDLRALLAGKGRQANLPNHERKAMALDTHRHLLTQAADAVSIEQAWESVPKKLRTEPLILHAYVDSLIKLDAHESALKAIRSSLKQNWDPKLALRYSMLEAEDGVSQMAAVEDWFQRYGEQPELQLAAARLCLRNKLWGKARSYLQDALKSGERPDVYLELGRLYEQTDEKRLAEESFRKGLELATRQNI